MLSDIKIHRSDLWAGLIFVLVFSGLFISIGLDFFSYIDELFELCMLICIILGIRNGKYNKSEKWVLVLSIILMCLGILGNIFYKYQTDLKVIILDIVAVFKGIIYYMGIKAINLQPHSSKQIVKKLYLLFVVYIIILLPFAFCNLFFDLGMSNEVKYGIKAFHFVFDAEGNYSLPFYVISSCIACHVAISKCYKDRKLFVIILTLLLWSLSLRSRAIGFSLLFVMLIAVLLRKRSKINKKLKLLNIIPILIILFFVGQDKIIYYFTNNRTARYNLLYYGVVTMKKCFPLGSGFATYGSAVTTQYYSPLYLEYNFSNIWGLGGNNIKFLNDGLWGEVFGQFGFFGTVVFVLIFAMIFINAYRVMPNRYGKFAVLYIVLILILGSVGTKTVMHFVVTPCFLLLGLLTSCMREE